MQRGVGVLAVIPYVALQVDRGVRAALRGFGGVPLLAVLLLIGVAVPVVLEGGRQQPINESVDGLRDGFSGLSGWVRMEGRIVTLTSPQAVDAGQQVQSLLIEPSGDAIVLLSHRELDDRGMVTGHVSGSVNQAEIARSVGGDRVPDEDLDIIDRYVLTVDDPIVPPVERNWTPAWIAVVAAGLLLVGRLVGYPVIRRTSGSAEGARPLGMGESIRVRVVERQEETGLSLEAPRGSLTRLDRRLDSDPYFSLAIEGVERPLYFRRHQWSTAQPGMLWMVADHGPVLEVRDWGIEVLLAVEDEADRDRLLASFEQARGTLDPNMPRKPANDPAS